ncbi:hypothetical protein HNR06_001585 [Nocardiopsis arvandica]|uniref:Pyrrolo-quinoline quinone n=1 Tax=Nocardiopsis sinuspersici TaxID=501010 RepID=A0A7Y9XA27_9ACTN|nr:PQQ-binding-like beta-propeller repeat protein [Nocardiopsis sinuspersici]NYH51996.1 hypothetical protein [Nocardiopsis sinuspersici]
MSIPWKKILLWVVGVAACISVLIKGALILLLEEGTDQISETGGAVLHETADGGSSEPSVPTVVSRVAWTWGAPEGARIGQIHPVPTGAVLQLNDGAVGVDTDTGQTAWVYRVPDADADVAVSPDGSSAVVSTEGSLAVLDTRTGEQKYDLKHDYAAQDSLTVATAGLVSDNGMVTSAEGEGGVVIELTPWSNSEEGWRSAALECPGGEIFSGITQAFATQARVVLIYECGEEIAVMVGLGEENGEQQWTLPLDGFNYTSRHDFGVVGDVAVLENISAQRGTVVIDTEKGELISGELLDELGNDILRILPDGYLAVREYQSGDLHYEMRGFSDEVQKSVSIDSGDVAGSITNFLPMSDALLKLTFVDGAEDTQVSVFEWGSEKPGQNIDLPIEMEVIGLTSLRKSDAAMGPGSFEAVPGAVIIRGYPSTGQINQIVGLK